MWMTDHAQADFDFETYMAAKKCFLHVSLLEFLIHVASHCDKFDNPRERHVCNPARTRRM